MWKILQLENPDDFVIGTGETHSIREFLDYAFGYLDMDWTKYVKIDPNYLRPTEVENLCADITKAKNMLNWEPKIKFHQLVKIMVDFDLSSMGLEPPGEGFKILREKKMTWTNNIETKG